MKNLFFVRLILIISLIACESQLMAQCECGTPIQVPDPFCPSGFKQSCTGDLFTLTYCGSDTIYVDGCEGALPNPITYIQVSGGNISSFVQFVPPGGYPIGSIVPIGTTVTIHYIIKSPTNVRDTLCFNLHFESLNAANIFSQPTNQFAAIGSTATFSVDVEGYLPFSYQWRKNGVNIAGTNSYTYTTPALSLSDNGNTYSCVVTNCSGLNSVTSNNAIPTVCVPPTIQTKNIAFNAVCANQMTVNWANGNGTRRVVKINTSNSFNAPANGTDPIPNAFYVGAGEQVVYNGSSNSVTVSGLSPYTTYWYRIYEANCSGNGSTFKTTTAVNNPKSMNTPQPMVLTFSTTITCVGVQNGTATVNVTGGNGSKTYKWSTVPVATTKTITGLAGGNYTVTVTDSKGCTVVGVATVPVPPVLTGVVTVTQNNNGSYKATIVPSGGLGPTFYYRMKIGSGSWSAPQPNGIFNNLAAGQYFFEIKDGCNTTIELFKRIGGKRVFGWYPAGFSSTSSFDWDILTDFCYFKYDVNPNTGVNSTFDWDNYSQKIAPVLSHPNVNPLICIFLNQNHHEFLNNPAARAALINSLISELIYRGGRGVNVDFEEVPSSEKNLFSIFLTELSNQIHSYPGWELSVDVQMARLSSYDFSNLINNGIVDYFICMGYDFELGIPSILHAIRFCANA